MKTYFHGEVVAKKICKLPDGLNKVKPKNGKYIVADSETTGNHHCIQDIKEVVMYEKDGVLYLENSKEVNLFCVDETRHDTQVLEPGTWEIGRANEYDFLTEMKRKVAD